MEQVLTFGDSTTDRNNFSSLRSRNTEDIEASLDRSMDSYEVQLKEGQMNI